MVNENNSRALYLQLSDWVCDGIMKRTFQPGSRLPSVRELAAASQVNVNTAMRAYEYLAMHGIIANRRGIGYFVTDVAPKEVERLVYGELMCNEIHEIFRRLAILGVSAEDLNEAYTKYLKDYENNN